MDAPFIVKVESTTALIDKMRFANKEDAKHWAQHQADKYPADARIWITLDVPGRPLRFYREGD